MDYHALINRPKTKKGRKTLDRIVSAAAQTFYEKGYHNSSISDITRLAGVASGTFYVYFDSKYNLYRFLLFQCSHMIRKHLSQSIMHCKTRKEAEEVGLREWLYFVRNNQYVYYIIWESLYIDKQLFVDYYVNFAKAYMAGINEAKDRGEICREIDSEVLAYTLMGASNFLGLNWGLFKEDTGDLEQVVESFMYILNGTTFVTGKAVEKPVRHTQPIRICVEFEDDGLGEGEEQPSPEDGPVSHKGQGEGDLPSAGE